MHDGGAFEWKNQSRERVIDISYAARLSFPFP